VIVIDARRFCDVDVTDCAAPPLNFTERPKRFIGQTVEALALRGLDLVRVALFPLGRFGPDVLDVL